MRKCLIISIMLITILSIFPGKVYANVDNLFIEHDKNYNAELLFSKSEYTGIKSLNLTGKDTEELTSSNEENRYLVKFDSDVSLEQINSLIVGYKYKIISNSSNRLFRIVIDNMEEFNIISKSMIKWIEPDYKTKLNVIPNDQYLSSQWAINALSLPEAWDITQGSNTTYVAVIDSGVNRSHEDLLNNQIHQGWDIILDKAVERDTIGHGTGVTGVIAATSNNNLGISGACWNVVILPFAVTYDDGTIYTSDVVEAIKMAADLGCKVINLSLGGPDFSISEDEAIQYAINKGCIIVAAAGNDSNSTINYPASLDNVISVGSINENREHSSFSNNNSYIDVSAPGENILTLSDDYSNNYPYNRVNGTSFSAPYVSGIAALAATIVPDITATQFKNAIIASSTDLGTVGYDNYYGYGLINARKLLQYLTHVPVSSVSVKSSTTLTVGQTEQLTATITPVDATDPSVTWSVNSQSGSNIATVSATGLVTAVNAGSAAIRATSNSDPTIYAECTVKAADFSATPLVQIGINPNDGDSAGIFIGLKDIIDTSGKIVSDAKLAGYQIEVNYDHDQVIVFDIYNETKMEYFNADEVDSDKISVEGAVSQGTPNFEKLFFVPLAITGVSGSTNVIFKFTSLTDTGLNHIVIPDVTVTLHRGKILNQASQQSISSVDAVAGLQYLANIVDAGMDQGQVNVINMASILQPEAGATSIKPSVKHVVALMQKLVGLRDDLFQIVSR